MLQDTQTKSSGFTKLTYVYNFIYIFLKKLASGHGNVAFQNKIYNVACLIVGSQCLISFYWNYSLGLSIYLNIVQGATLIVYCFLYYYGRYKNIYYNFLFVITTLAVLSSAWINSEGIKGSVPLLYIVLIAIFVTISNNKSSILYLLLTIIDVILLLLLEYYFEELFVKYPDEKTRQMDIYFTLAAVFFLIFFFISYYKKNYDKENTIIQKQKAELQKLNSTKDKFFSIIAHDLKSPLGSMLSLVKILLENHREYDDEKRGHYIQLINNSTSNIYDLLDNLLTWARSQSGKIEFMPQKIPLHDFIDDALLLHEQIASERKIKLVNNVETYLYVKADKNLVNTILRNLIANGIKYTPEEGNIIIAAKESDAKLVEISVKDTGIGIHEDRVKELFNVGETKSTPGLNKEKGTGIGLVICKEFVEKHGGTIWVESKVNEGTVFRFTLPN